MPPRFSAKPITEAAVLTGLAALIGILGTLVPFLSLLTPFVWPLPLIVLQVRQGLKVTVLALVANALLMVPLLGVPGSLLIVGFLGLLALAYGFAFRRRYPPLQAYLMGAIGLAIGIAVLIGLSHLFLGENMIAQTAGLLDTILNESLKQSAAGLTPDQLAVLQEFTALAKDLFARYWPVLFLAAAFILALGEYTLAESLLPRFGITVRPFRAFARWQLPLLPILLVWAPSLVVTRAAFRYPALTKIAPLAADLYILCSIAFVIEGLAVTYFYLTMLRVPRPLGAVLLLFLAMVPFTQDLAMWFGIFDFLFDYRRLRVRPQG